MTEATTIKVPKPLRDRLQARAKEAGIAMADVIERLLDQDARARRFARIRMERLQSPPDGSDEPPQLGLEQSALADLRSADAPDR